MSSYADAAGVGGGHAMASGAVRGVISSLVAVASGRAHSSTPSTVAASRSRVQRVVEVGGQLGQVRDVGAEVVAADAAEPDRAGAAAGLDVGRFGAAAVGDGDLADCVAGVLGFQQGVGVAPEPVAVPIEAQGGHGLDDGAAALFPDA